MLGFMAWTSDDLTAIEDAIKSGQLSVKFRDREIKYRSLDELLKVRDLIRDDLGTGTSFCNRGLYTKTSKGT